MKIRLELDGKVFELERQPMAENRFKALCWLAAGGLYVCLVWIVGTLCSFPGVAVLGILTLLIVMAISMSI